MGPKHHINGDYVQRTDGERPRVVEIYRGVGEEEVEQGDHERGEEETSWRGTACPGAATLLEIFYRTAAHQIFVYRRGKKPENGRH